MGKKHGSKEAYEASRAGAREANRRWNMTNEERKAERIAERKRKRDNLDELTGDRAMHNYMLFLAAAIAGGATKPAQVADTAIETLKSRFT